MVRGAAALALIGALFITGCRRSEDAPAPAAPVPARVPPPAPVTAGGEPPSAGSAQDGGATPQAAGAVDPVDVAACREGLVAALPKVEGMHPTRRLPPSLKAFGAHCEAVVGPLAIAAREASEMGMPRRAERLARDAELVLPPTCATHVAAGPALEVAYACPPPETFALAEPLLKDLDAGSYLFALAMRERLGQTGVLDERVDRLLSNLVLAGALEGEQRRQAGGR